jgi:hypothetical protein
MAREQLTGAEDGLTEASFIADHGLDVMVQMGEGEPRTLREAQLWEEVCEATEERRTDPALRLKKLAKAAHATGSLLPKYAHLVEPTE